ncbi:winged helix-turn-helix transcriptional regulator [Specibacter cremeus]|uniref:winged helix-turn-helix transcriptional regulator n=1 Tax=Specibacter cremeus TaxID=1629051 RepID=UPI000F7BB1F4|nr:helix-turn-helix domain-containing protein [Specibacter cremeus]
MDTKAADMVGNVLDPNCPSRVVLARVGDKWAALIIAVLEDGPRRFSELKGMVGVVTPKVLTQTLRTLERDGLLRRTIHAQVPPRVDYELTDLGATLLEPLATLRHWAEHNVAAMLRARDRYDDAQDGRIAGD